MRKKNPEIPDRVTAIYLRLSDGECDALTEYARSEGYRSNPQAVYHMIARTVKGFSDFKWKGGQVRQKENPLFEQLDIFGDDATGNAVDKNRSKNHE
jgi:hypothetical protein